MSDGFVAPTPVHLNTSNPTIQNHVLYAQVTAELSRLVLFYTLGIDKEGNDVSRGNSTLTDGKLDDHEISAIVLILNTMFRDRGVVISSEDIIVG